MADKHIIEEMKFVDKICDGWSHRRTCDFFMKIVERGHNYIVVRPRCFICDKMWKPKRFHFTIREYDRRVQAYISSIIARHFRKVHGFDMVKVDVWTDGVGIYKCPRCGKEVIGFMHAVAHFIVCKVGRSDER